MIRVTLAKNGAIKQQDGIGLLDEWSREDLTQRVWIDITAPAQGDIEPLLEEQFGFHELATEDSLSYTTLPKYDPFPGYDFFIFRAINMNLKEHGVDTIKLAVFIGPNFLFTIHTEPMVSTQTIWTRIAQDRRMIERGVDFLLYAILDVLVDLHFPLLDEIEDCVDEIHETIFANPKALLLDELLHLKRDLNVLRRHSLPQRELFNQISRGDAAFIQPDTLIYFRDLYDHMFRISESIDTERDLMSGTMEAYLSVVANRTNDIMKVLTIFSAIMLPMNFVASIYGMNFEHMPELKWPFGYAFAGSLMLTICVVMLLWFWQQGWLGGKQPDRGHSLRELERRRGERRSAEAIALRKLIQPK